ncbi:oxygen-dependent tRNA uridine(34) hydroxylase TrhO [Parafrigoribacterium soli]|uniref:oxygen-dependent tRNA uridine(34) hydroxylase TrhO n=1 Tax=Parafrigoribacterium soli TaxID=3144663 RepID=UPI0032EC3CB2
MAVPKILLFYVFTPLADPDAIRLWQRDLCESLGLGGRIILSKDGMNGTVGGELKQVKRYIKKTREYPAFKDIDFKWSEGHGGDFPRLSVRVRDELVSFGAPGELRVDENGVVGGGQRLTPEQLHELVESKEVTFFDGRNQIEAAIGHFKDAVVPQVSNTREFMAELDSGRYDHLKDKPVVTYCTGGIRCEVLSSLMINRGFTDVYQLDGGIATYGERFGDSGLWEGSLYVFDNRLSLDFTDDAVTIGRCYSCGTATRRTVNCSYSPTGAPSCREQFVSCDEHAAAALCDEHATSAFAPTGSA